MPVRRAHHPGGAGGGGVGVARSNLNGERQGEGPQGCHAQSGEEQSGEREGGAGCEPVDEEAEKAQQ